MEPLLTELEARVLGSLIEKAITTPDYYPLTLNALLAACNQKSNRHPVTNFDEKSVVRALDTLRFNQLAGQVTVSGARVFKYKHTLENRFVWTEPQRAVMCELLLRGPQTAAELRTRCERLLVTQDSAQMDATLQSLLDVPDGALAVKLPKEHGCREHRFAHLLCGEVTLPDVVRTPPLEPAALEVRAENERLASLEMEVQALRKDLDEIKQMMLEFRKQFE